MAYPGILIFIQACSAKTGEGLVEGLEWISNKLARKKSTKFPNNPYKIDTYNQIKEQDSFRSKESPRSTIAAQNLTINCSINTEIKTIEEK